MGTNQSSQLQSTLQHNVEQALRSHNEVPRPVFTQMLIEKESHNNRPSLQDNGTFPPTEEQTSEVTKHQWTGYCSQGQGITLQSFTKHDIPSGYLLVGIWLPGFPDGQENILVVAIDNRFAPDPRANLALPGFRGMCVGCGKSDFIYFKDFVVHINLSPTPTLTKQNCIRYFIRSTEDGSFMRGPPVPWRKRNAQAAKATTPPAMPGSPCSPPFNRGPPPLIRVGRVGVGQFMSPETVPLKKRRSSDAFSSSTPTSRTPDIPLAHRSPSPIQQYLKMLDVTPVILMCRGQLQFPSNCFIYNGSLYECFSMSAVRLGNRQDLSIESRILMTVQHLVQLASGNIPTREVLNRYFSSSQDSFHGLSLQYQTQKLSFDQLLWWSSAIASTSHDRVKVVWEATFEDGVVSALRFATKSKMRPRYSVVLSSRSKDMQCCILVTGTLECHGLNESNITGDSLHQEIEATLTGDKTVHLNTLHHLLNKSCIDLDTLMKDFAQSLNGEVFVPFLGVSEKTTVTEHVVQTIELKPPQQKTRNVYSNMLSSSQKLVCKNLLQRVLENCQDVGNWNKVNFIIVIPSKILYNQILEQLHISDGLLKQLGLGNDSIEDHMCLSGADGDSVAKMNSYVDSIQQHLQTLHVVIVESAHLQTEKHTSQNPNLLDQFHDDLQTSNVMILYVTSSPYALQTSSSQVAQCNEVHWSWAGCKKEKSTYTSLVTISRSCLDQTPARLLLRDEEFENKIQALITRSPELHTMIVRSFTLVQQYVAALMCLAGIHGARNATSLQLLSIMKIFVEQPLKSQHGYGSMIILRVPSKSIALTVKTRLQDVVQKLGFQYRFDILVSGVDDNVDLKPNQFFCRQLKTWNGTDTVSTLTDLENLPCILIRAGEELAGETLPSSVCLLDLRLLNQSTLTRTMLEQELGQICGYHGDVRSDTKSHQSNLAQIQENSTKPNILERRMKELRHTSLSGTPSPTESTSTESMHSSELAQAMVGLNTDNGSASSSSPLPSSSPSSSGSVSSDVETNGSTTPKNSNSRHSTNTKDTNTSFILLSDQAYKLVKCDSKNLKGRYTSDLKPHHNVQWLNGIYPSSDVKMTAYEESQHHRMYLLSSENHIDHRGPSDTCASRFMLTGPPQVGKTLVYIEFLRMLSEQLKFLPEVTVYDNAMCHSQILAAGRSQNGRSSPFKHHWPDLETMETMPFDPQMTLDKYINASQAFQYDKCQEKTPNATPQSTKTVYLSSFAAYGSKHLCQDCKSYRKGDNAAQIPSTCHKFIIMAYQDAVPVEFIIPGDHEHKFTFGPAHEMVSIKLALTEQEVQHFKSPIFTISQGRHDTALLNLFHCLKGSSHLHVVVVKHKDRLLYEKTWPNHVLMVLPPQLNNCGIGTIQYIIGEFSNNNLELERRRYESLGVSRSDVWPFILQMDDNIVMTQKQDIHKQGQSSAVTLKSIIQHLESTPKVNKFSQLGIQPWGSLLPKVFPYQQPFTRSHLHGIVMLNVDVIRNIQYDYSRFTFQDVDFNLRLSKCQLPSCCFTMFSYMSQFPRDKSNRPYPEGLSPPGEFPPTEEFVISLQSKTPTIIPASAHYLLEQFLSHFGSHIFPLSVKNRQCPVLSINSYINLGPDILVNVVSSKFEALSPQDYGVVYSALLLYMPGGYVRGDFLKRFKFLPGSRVCLICPDHLTLRQTVVFLELEERWHFKLCNEYKTANSAGDKPVFLLTGDYNS